MSRFGYIEYRQSKALVRDDPSFYALIGAAMRKADFTNQRILSDAYPDVWRDLLARYNAPGGVLPSDPPGLVTRALEEGRAS